MPGKKNTWFSCGRRRVAVMLLGGLVVLLTYLAAAHLPTQQDIFRTYTTFIASADNTTDQGEELRVERNTTGGDRGGGRACRNLAGAARARAGGAEPVRRRRQA